MTLTLLLYARTDFTSASTLKQHLEMELGNADFAQSRDAPSTASEYLPGLPLDTVNLRRILDKFRADLISDLASAMEMELENQHRQIKGYRELNEDEIRAMNQVKEVGIIIGELVEDMEAATKTQVLGPDARWVAIGKTHLQQGLMALTRAIAKPDFF